MALLVPDAGEVSLLDMMLSDASPNSQTLKLHSAVSGGIVEGTVHTDFTEATFTNIGITLLRRIAEIPLTVANVGQVLDGVALGLPRLYADSCLALMVHCTATNTGAILGSLVAADG